MRQVPVGAACANISAAARGLHAAARAALAARTRSLLRRWFNASGGYEWLYREMASTLNGLAASTSLRLLSGV